MLCLGGNSQSRPCRAGMRVPMLSWFIDLRQAEEHAGQKGRLEIRPACFPCIGSRGMSLPRWTRECLPIPRNGVSAPV